MKITDIFDTHFILVYDNNDNHIKTMVMINITNFSYDKIKR